MATVPMVVAPEMAAPTLVTAPPPPGSLVPNNAYSVMYFDENKQVDIASFILFFGSDDLIATE